MTRDELLKLAREAGFECFEWGGSEHVVFTGCEGPVTDLLERFAALVESRVALEGKLILELAIREMSLALDALTAECTDADGKPKAPSRQVLMRSRGMLPPYCERALSKTPTI